MIFESLRIIPFEPEFKWVETIEEAADYINRPHEDYPKYVSNTVSIIRTMMKNRSTNFSAVTYLITHMSIFKDWKDSGRFREINVTIGLHHPPEHRKVWQLIKELDSRYNNQVETIEGLIEWYKDFETIHPFSDGNGRVGGTIVAVYGQMMEPEKGYLAPLQ